MKQVFTKTTVIIAMAIAVLVAGFFYALSKPESSAPVVKTVTQRTSEATSKPETADPSAATVNTLSQNELLNYLLEEEKLAYDVYSVMHDTYGAKVFGNILNSEQTHQGEAMALLNTRNLPDSRTGKTGTFTNPELQTLYDQLIAQGKQSAEEAYKIGVAIEEKDIADITKQLATATDSNIVTTLEKLRTGSENHLRAFNRQLSRY
ncbi:DUF2202 domain-containing protein [Candidatus Saccharibacteria bacterium]|nr:MAG: DUF2202 domain-containing protein [Candidatus Saccharibacteria bacterium]